MDFVRVVALQKGKPKLAEFNLRAGERGLSVFHLKDQEIGTDILEAPRGGESKAS